MSEGPVIPRTSICFQYEVSAVHNLQATQLSLVRRFQGLSLPVHLRVSKAESFRLSSFRVGVILGLILYQFEGHTF